MYCTKCGTQLLDDAKFCTHCGIHSYAVPASANAPPPVSQADRVNENRSGDAVGMAADASPIGRKTATLAAQFQDLQNKSKRDGLLVNAGLGGAFGLLMGTALVHFLSLSLEDEAREIFAIVVVGVVVVKFIEPIAGHVREALHIAYAHEVAPKGWSIKLYALLTVAAISLADGMLHSLFMHNTGEAAGIMIGYVISGLIPAGITYFWLRGARSSPPRAKLYGLVSASVIAPAYLLLLLLVTQMESIRPLLLPSTITWALIAFAGGWAIDKQWKGRPTRGILLSLVISSAVVDLGFVLLYLLTTSPGANQIAEMLIRDVGRAAGWGTALLLYPGADSFFLPAQGAMATSHVAGETAAVENRP